MKNEDRQAFLQRMLDDDEAMLKEVLPLMEERLKLESAQLKKDHEARITKALRDGFK